MCSPLPSAEAPPPSSAWGKVAREQYKNPTEKSKPKKEVANVGQAYIYSLNRHENQKSDRDERDTWEVFGMMRLVCNRKLVGL